MAIAEKTLAPVKNAIYKIGFAGALLVGFILLLVMPSTRLPNNASTSGAAGVAHADAIAGPGTPGGDSGCDSGCGCGGGSCGDS